MPEHDLINSKKPGLQANFPFEHQHTTLIITLIDLNDKNCKTTGNCEMTGNT